MTFSVSGVFSWLIANKATLILAAATVVAGASLLIKALEMVVAALLVVFPSLQTVDGGLKSIAAWLDALSKSSFLNSFALSPKTAKKLVVALAFCFALGAGAPASAQVLVSSGPTVPLMEVRPGNLHPVSLAAGAGYQISFTAPVFQRAIAGRAWDLLDITAMAFGSTVSATSGPTFGAFSAAVGLCTLSSLLCAGVGHDVATAPGLAPGWFGVFALSVNFDSQPSSPPAGIARGTMGLARGNTLYFGAP